MSPCSTTLRMPIQLVLHRAHQLLQLAVWQVSAQVSAPCQDGESWNDQNVNFDILWHCRWYVLFPWVVIVSIVGFAVIEIRSCNAYHSEMRYVTYKGRWNRTCTKTVHQTAPHAHWARRWQAATAQICPCFFKNLFWPVPCKRFTVFMLQFNMKDASSYLEATSKRIAS